MVSSAATLDPALSLGPAQGLGGGAAADGWTARENGRILGFPDVPWPSPQIPKGSWGGG